MAVIGIVNLNQNEMKKFPKVVKQSPALPAGMYKAIYNRFVTLGFHEDSFNEGKLKFYAAYGFELVEDMAGNKIPAHVKEFDDGTREEAPKCVFRDYPVTDDLHHKSGGYSIAKALTPNVPTIRRGKDKEHEYIIGYDWEAPLGTSVLVMLNLKKAKESGNEYNQIAQVMPLGMPLVGEVPNTYFSLYDPTHKEVFDTQVFPYERKKIKESTVVPGEPEVIYREAKEAPAAPVQAPQEPAIPPVDFDDTIPF